MDSSNCCPLDPSASMDTQMVVNCGPRNCSNIDSNKEANIAFPISMFLTGTIGNAIAIFVLHRSSRREQMKTVFYVLVGSLAWTDLMGIVLTTIPVLIVYIRKSEMDKWLCNYHAFTMICIGLITPFIVCTMAIERYLGIRHGYFYKRHVNRSRACQVLLAQWIFVLLFTSLPFFGFGQYAKQYPNTWCFFNLHPMNALDQAYAFIYAILTLILILIMILCNISVIGTLIGMRYRRKYLNSPSRERQIHRSPRQREIEIQMVILLVGITFLFTTCWAPLMIQVISNQLWDHKDDHSADILTVRLASVNQTFDPWVYILFRKVIFTKFWLFLRRLVPCSRSKAQLSLEQKTAAAAQTLLGHNGHAPPHCCQSHQPPPRRHHRHHHHHCHCQCPCPCKGHNRHNPRHLLRSLLPSPTPTPSFRSPEKSNGTMAGSNNNLPIPLGASPHHLTPQMERALPTCPVIIQCEEESTLNSPVGDDSAYEAEPEENGNCSLNGDVFSSQGEEEEEGPAGSTHLSPPTQCPNCQYLKFGKAFPLINLDEGGGGERGRSWSHYLPETKLGVAFKKTHKLSAPTASESSRDPQKEESAQSAMI